MDLRLIVVGFTLLASAILMIILLKPEKKAKPKLPPKKTAPTKTKQKTTKPPGPKPPGKKTIQVETTKKLIQKSQKLVAENTPEAVEVVRKWLKEK